ncbi:hypothetical protein GJ744_002455 [Endocarpon pusillum]|uniref:Uncharacterized protein n=1 Tax=Endocarpon pusillum TaxID=364733 RepID=A0A8H7AFP3_9EURO|nr:hypothetical protein GJ744_002455 [Endocarpon pusillum]
MPEIYHELSYRDTTTQNPLLWAAQTGNVIVAKMLIEGGEDVTITNDADKDALTLAATRGSTEIVSLLLATNKVNPDRKNKSGRTPLSYAAQWERPDVVALFLKSGKVDPDSRDNTGRTPLSHVAGEARGLTRSVSELLITSDRVNPESKDKEGRTPLSYAGQRGHRSAAKLLISSGKVDPDSKDNDGRTTLSYACSGPFIESFISYFISLGAVNIELKDNVGRTPLSHAAADGCASAIRELLKHGADCESKDDLGQTPLTWARKSSEAYEQGLPKERISFGNDKYKEVLELLNHPCRSSNKHLESPYPMVPKKRRFDRSGLTKRGNGDESKVIDENCSER